MTDGAALRHLWEIDLKGEPLPEGADDQAGITYLARLVRVVSIPAVDVTPDTVWLWSDLHVGDPGVLSRGLPYGTTEEMDDHPLDAWRRQVRRKTSSSRWVTSPIPPCGFPRRGPPRPVGAAQGSGRRWSDRAARCRAGQGVGLVRMLS